MILYHGTGETLGKTILKTGFISKDVKSNFSNFSICNNRKIINLQTESGYIYLTNYLSKAYYYANAGSKNEDEHIYIFKCNIPEKLLLPDLDEIRICYNSQEEEFKELNSVELLNKIKSTRIIKNIDFENYDVELLIIPCHLNLCMKKEGYLTSETGTLLKRFMELRCEKPNDLKELAELTEKIEKIYCWKKLK
ncbi:MAG: hypothetical protein SOY68_11490 [Fusobacterium varium]|uniref:hypothetical protein n=1 Tax=Fusobacterium varium TaxID=856 RepID=UPI0024330815|nr:hypothetical protein [Fusobacterium varium]MCI6031219.1 hypothetical protein [Fusobacterium varium]MDY4006524.1 hypothetical protein [Fusobacterium varium]